MGYIRKTVQRKLDIMDKKILLPPKWNKFLDEVKPYFGLIIKGRKNNCRCTNCENEFICKKEVLERTKCPKCKHDYLIRASNLKSFYETSRLILLDKVENELVFRYFEIYASCSKCDNYKFKFSVVEFARSFPDNEIKVVNDRLAKCQCNIYVHHWEKIGKWREYTRFYDFKEAGFVYPYNLKKLLKFNQEYKYLNLGEFVKKVGPINFERMMYHEFRAPCFEILSKLKLYKLALNAFDFSNSEGSFNKIFGVPKDYYKFMKTYNINYDELKILRLYKKKDIKKVRFLANFNHYGEIKEIGKYISYDNIYKYLKMKKQNAKLYVYKDYLRFANLLGLDLKNKKYIFPDDVEKRHDELEKAIEVRNREKLNGLIKERLNELKKNIYNDKRFIIIPAESVEELENESNQQSNCVRTYSEKYAVANCDIYFMRLLKNKKKSLVTVEVKDNKVVQSRTRFNNMPEEIHLKFLEKWQKKVLQQSCRV